MCTLDIIQTQINFTTMILIETQLQRHGEKTLTSFLLSKFDDWMVDVKDNLVWRTKEIGIEGIVKEYFSDDLRSIDRDDLELFCEQWGYADYLQEMIDEENFEKGK